MMEWLSQLHWQQPAWLLMLPLPMAAMVIKHRAGHRLATFIAPELWRWLLVDNPRDNRRRAPLILLAAWGLACVAAAGPMVKGGESIGHGRPAVNMAIIVDISPSMAVTDIPPNRLDHSRLQLRNAVDALNATRLALIAFSANAYTVLPLTTDRGTFNHFLANLTPDLVSLPGSNLTRALELADQALSQPIGDKTPPGGLVVLISDGEIHDRGALKATQTLRRHGHRLYTLGVGTEAGGPVPSLTGRLIRDEFNFVVSKRDRATLQTLAKAGAGAYADLGPEGWQTVTDALSTLRAQALESGPLRDDGTALFPILLAAALALMLWHTLRHPQALALWLLLPGVMMMDDVHAAPWQEANGLKKLRQGNYQAALNIYSQLNNYTGLIGYGVASYKLEQWTDAETAFRAAVPLADNAGEHARAHYNLGNTLVQLGRLDEADDAYRTALRWQPDHGNARRNLALLARHNRGTPDQAPPPMPSTHGDGMGTPINRGEGPPDDQGATANADNSDTRAQAAAQPTLEASLDHWRQLSGGEAPAQRLLQQLDHLEEDTTTFLKYRFAQEDDASVGRAMEKPW